jgi:hypothetical protein
MTKFEGFSTTEQKKIENVLNRFDRNFIKEIFKKIINDQTLDNKEEKYSVFGKYNINSKTLKINPRAFITEDFTDGKNKMSKLSFIILHEIAHALDRRFKVSNSEEWHKLSGWVEEPIIKRGKKNLVMKKENGDEVHSQWFYDKNAKFARWYSSFSPKEDFCDTFSFAFSGLKNNLKNKEKIDYVEHFIAHLKTRGII